MMEEADLVSADFESHPIYLISALGMNGLLSWRSSALTSLNLSMSIDFVRIPCAIMLYIGILMVAPFLLPLGYVI